MSDLLAKDATGVVSFRAGDPIKGAVIDANPSRILLDLPGGATGIITKKEILKDDSTAEELEPGVEVEAVILDPENEAGLVVLSLKRASQDAAWAELSQACEDERIIKVKIEEANKGGLMARYKGLKSFLPVSQLTPLHYPRVQDGGGSEILRRLQEHIGKTFAVRVINISREEGKIILSEKAAHDEQISKTLEGIEEGSVVKGEVSGVMKFGIFVAFGGVEGLVHLSELDWAHVADPAKRYSIGDQVEVLIIGKEGDKLSLSIKRLSEDPWTKKAEKFAVGDTVSGKVSRWNQNGVFIEIEPDVQGLFSLEQFGVESHSDLKVKERDEMKGEILEINQGSHRLELKKVD